MEPQCTVYSHCSTIECGTVPGTDVPEYMLVSNYCNGEGIVETCSCAS